MTFLTELAGLKTAIIDMSAAVVNALKRVATATPVNGYVTLAADEVIEYDLQTLLGEGYASFDLKAAEIIVRAKDINPASPLYNVQANAEALISYGIRNERYVVVANQSTGPLDVYVKVVVNPV